MSGKAATNWNVPRSILVATGGFVYRPMSSINLGDRAQLTRTVQRLNAAFPQTRLVVVGNSPSEDGDVDGLDVSFSAIEYLTSPLRMSKLNVRLPTHAARLLRAVILLANAGRVRKGRQTAFLSTDGKAALHDMAVAEGLFISGAGVFNDLFFAGVGGFWCILARVMKSLGKPVVASGQQIGPLNRLRNRALSRWAFRAFDPIGVRDPRSMSIAKGLDVPSHRLVLTGDDA